jgi:hypothetical protein
VFDVVLDSAEYVIFDRAECSCMICAKAGVSLAVFLVSFRESQDMSV